MRQAAGLSSLRDALSRAGDAQAVAALPVHASRVRQLAEALGLPYVEVSQIRGINTPTSSPRVKTRFGTGSVAEATALVAAGVGGRIVSRRVTSQDGLATAAIAEAP